MIADRLLLGEGFINLLAGAGLLSFLIRLFMHREHSVLERRMFLLLLNLAALFLARAVKYGTGTEQFDVFILVMSSVMPFAVVVFTEGLMRRHVPLGLKIFSVVGTIGLVIGSFYHEPGGLKYPIALVTDEVVILGWAMCIAWRRNTKELSVVENRYINGIGIIAALVLPLMVTDFRAIFGWNLPRMGALGGLLLAFALVRLSEKTRKTEMFHELIFIVVADLIATFVYCLVWNDFASIALVYPVFVTLHLFVVLMKEVIFPEDRVQDWIFDLLHGVEEDSVKDLAGFQSLVQKRGSSRSILALSEPDLIDFDVPALRALFGEHAHLPLATLRAKKWRSHRGGQQLRYILESYQMNQAHLVAMQPLCVVLVNAPAIGGANDYQREVGVLRSFLALLERRSS